MYIHELSNWPNFSWDQSMISDLLIQLRYKQGRLIGVMESIGFHVQEETILQTITSDVVKSSEIEGEILDRSLVRSSVARHLGMETAADPIDRNVEGVVEMVLDATQRFDQPLTKERLLSWHSSLFPTGRSNFSNIKVGEWRSNSVQVISGHYDKEMVHFEGPPAHRLDQEMKTFLDWLNNDESHLDLILKAAIAHLWFVTIHPFDDGNGRIGRAIADFGLARSENSTCRFYSLSTQIQKERKSYYEILEKTQRGSLDISDWLVWFLSCLERALESASSIHTLVLKKDHFWKSNEKIGLNERQKKVINLLLEDFSGKLTTSKWAKLTKSSQDTAYRDILDLIEKGILAKSSGGGRSTSYDLVSPTNREK